MLRQTVKDYSEYLKLDLANGFQTVQEVIDNMITRLEELSSVIQMIKLKNNDCSIAVTEDICRYRNEVTVLSKKIVTLRDVVMKLQTNVEILEKQVEKAESDFGIQTDNKFTSFLKPFLKRKDVIQSDTPFTPGPREKIVLPSVLENFIETDTIALPTKQGQIDKP